MVCEAFCPASVFTLECLSPHKSIMGTRKLYYGWCEIWIDQSGFSSGKKCTALMLTVKTAKTFEVGQRFLLEIALNRHKKGFTNLKKTKQIVK